jgi:hypothetical protein
MQISAMILLLAALLLDGCGACGEDKLAETGSPGNRYVATTFRRGCAERVNNFETTGRSNLV